MRVCVAGTRVLAQGRAHAEGRKSGKVEEGAFRLSLG